ncbi:SHOCT domain-containing protein [Plantibacter flavus]|nr:SHOCT domain-containing protein [Plantibacter flavus]
MDATVSTVIGSDLVVQAGLKWKKLNDVQVSEWEEVLSESKDGVVSAVGQAVAGALLPRFLSKGGSAAVGAALEARRPPRVVRVSWADGKRSLVRLPDELFTHFALVLEHRRTEPAPVEMVTSSGITASSESDGKPRIAEQALTHLAEILKDRLPRNNAPAIEPGEAAAPHEIDIAAQLSTLSQLHQAGLISEAEFTEKRSEMLMRL